MGSLWTLVQLYYLLIGVKNYTWKSHKHDYLLGASCNLMQVWLIIFVWSCTAYIYDYILYVYESTDTLTAKRKLLEAKIDMHKDQCGIKSVFSST